MQVGTKDMRDRWCKGPKVPNSDIRIIDGHLVEAIFVEAMFSSKGTRNTLSRVRTRCRLCEQTRRDFRKSENRLRVKAASTIRSHAERYAVKWSVSISEAKIRLMQLGWTADYITAMFEEAVENGRCWCGSSWDLGQHDMTLEVLDPDTPVMSRCEVWCRSCNSEKGAMPESMYALVQQFKKQLFGSPYKKAGQQKFVF